MQILIWVMTGALAGWLAGKMMKGRDYGLAGNLILGLIGGIVGGWLLHLLGGIAPTLWWQQVLTASKGVESGPGRQHFRRYVYKGWAGR